MSSLRYWVADMHVDGLRFDLASSCPATVPGGRIPDPPVLADIESDPVLAGTKLIAEPWDAAGLYQVGRFLGGPWSEWNGRFRDQMRAVREGDGGTVQCGDAPALDAPTLPTSTARQSPASTS